MRNTLMMLIEASKAGAWDAIDPQLPAASKEQEIFSWAFRRGLDCPNENVRDLSASVLEKTPRLTVPMKAKLLSKMTTDPHRYVRYRSAFAIAAHDTGYHKDQVHAVLREAQADPDVSETAAQYLAAYK